MIELAELHNCGILPYVYRLDNSITGEFYIGFREANTRLPELDIGVKYKTSSKYVKPRFSEFSITILAVFYSREDAYWFEQDTIKENFKTKGCLNKSYNNYRTGKVFSYSINSNSKEAMAKISKSLKGRKQTPEHVEKNRIRQIGVKKSDAHRLALCVPKTITKELKAQWEKLKNPDSMSKPRKCSCLICKKKTSSNQLN